MQHTPGFLSDLAIVLLVASATALISRRLGQPTVLGYLVAGLIVGPYLPFPVFADPDRTHALSELGVVLVMFVVGLELRLKRLVAVLPTAGVTTVFEVAVLLGAGYGVGRLIGWPPEAAVFLGAAICISSTMVVSKLFEERPVTPDVRGHVMSVLVIQDVIAIVLAAVLTAVAAGHALSAMGLMAVIGRLSAVLVGIVVGGLLVVPRLIRRVARTGSDELMVVVCMGVCFGLALAAEELGYSVALGAFFGGMLVAESGEAHRVEHLTRPLRDLFAAIFFASIGMTVDPRLAIEHLPTALLVSVVVIVGQAISVSVSGVLSGNGLRRSVTAGLALGQIGEFGFILAAIGVSAGIAPASLTPIVVTVAVLTALSSSIALRFADRAARVIDHHLPRSVQDVLSLHEAWFEKLRAPRVTPRSPVRRSVLVIAFDGTATAVIVVTAAAWFERLRAMVEAEVGLAAPWDLVVVVVGVALLTAVPIVSLLRAMRALGAQVAERVFGAAQGGAQERTRRLLVVSVQLLVLLAVGLPFAVVVLPFAGSGFVIAFGVAGVVTVWALWRAAGRVAPQVRWSADQLVDLLARQTSDAQSAVSHDPGLLGLERAMGVALDATSYAVGRTLAAIDLRAMTGATVVAIRSANAERRLPSGTEVLREGDVLALAGLEASLEDARLLLLLGPDGMAAEAGGEWVGAA